MTFLHPWAIIAGVLAAGIPVAVHFLTKPRPVRMPLSTLRFLREAIHQKRSRHVLRDVLILLLRTAAILLIALAIARPQWGGRPLVSDQIDGDTVRVVALDMSQSMAATDRGVAAWERARTTAANFLRYQPGLKANLIFVAAESRGVFESPSVNFEQLRKELADAEVLPQRVDVRKFVETAGKLLAPLSPEDQRRRELVIISDFQRSGWAKVDLTPLPQGTQIQWESVAPAETLPNLAVFDVRVNAQDASAGPSQCEIDVYNGSDHVRQVELELRIGESLWNLKTTCQPESTTTLVQELHWNESGWLAGEVRLLDAGDSLTNDALAADNVRPFVVHVPQSPVYAIITRQTASTQPKGRLNSSYYLQSALGSDQAGGFLGREAGGTGNGSSVVLVAPADFSSFTFSTNIRSTNGAEASPSSLQPQASGLSADLILLDHPGKLPEEVVKLLAGFLRRNKPILYIASESVDAVNLKSLLESVGENVQLPVDFVPPPAGQLRRDLTLVSVKRDRAPFNVFGDHLNSVLGQLRFSGGLDSRRLEGRPGDDLLAIYDDGSAGLVLTASDFGALAVLNADLNESNLPRTGAFVPLLEELIHALLHRNRKNEPINCGEPLFIQLPVDAGPATVLKTEEMRAGGRRLEAGVGTAVPLTDREFTKDSKSPKVNNTSSSVDLPTLPPPAPKNLQPHSFGDLRDEETGTVWLWDSPERPGVYAVKQEDRILFAKAAAIPAEESELESLDMETLASQLAGGHATYYRSVSESDERRDHLWVWFATACVLCMITEVGVMIVFRD